MLGNNAKSAKFRRIFVPFARDSNLNSIITGRYFFPENPELERKNITGIQIHFGGDDISINNSTILQGVPTANLGASWSSAANLSFLTLYTDEGDEKLSNFPVYGLYNQGVGFQRINIIPGKINIPKSYIYFVGTAAAITTSIVGFSITFFYN